MDYLKVIPGDITNIVYKFVSQPGPYTGRISPVRAPMPCHNMCINLKTNAPIFIDLFSIYSSECRVNQKVVSIDAICYDPVRQRLLYISDSKLYSLVDLTIVLLHYTTAKQVRVAPCTGDIWLFSQLTAEVFTSNLKPTFIIDVPDMWDPCGYIIDASNRAYVYGNGLARFEDHVCLFMGYTFINAAADGTGALCLLTARDELIHYISATEYSITQLAINPLALAIDNSGTLKCLIKS